ncbi:TIGR03013 family PEP-CTERM/XrtA system glycosyltransferase [Niveibacterium sp. 24ML]|uniref:TIGR03013 family XrtA/PEP-CTERM system glycosyltransferase n=1 Tax=Niveibacterium sp. 24ML TaxID=2985512 RepID=UPI00226DF341|nr:TIGR03013 family XrtA/PEP-CTERM system glycosyltransferase [Niveibacterium sp. 24ML]MCX9156915.1 TIGR03013 family PEP-CTERM/XrtA system glycosyltransferase [Niveibacterium sp. 24ML]
MLRLFNHYVPTNAFAQVLFDALLLFAAILVAASVQTTGGLVWIGEVAPSALLFACMMIALNGALGLYRGGPTSSLYDTLARILLSLLASIPVAYAAFRMLPWGLFDQHNAELTVVLILGSVLALRGFVVGAAGEPIWRRRILVIGTGDEAVAVDQSLRNLSSRGLSVVGFYPAANNDAVEVSGHRVLPASESLLEAVRSHNVNEIIVAVRERRGGSMSLKQLLDCKLAGVKVLDLSSFYERVRGQVRIDALKASWLIYGEGFRQGWVRSTIKRTFDLVVGTFMLISALPVMLVTAIAIAIESGLPIFYTQERVGRGGRVFRVIKFRSMRTDAEKDGKPRWASAKDDRVTRVGRIIRKTRIDELPQLLNVIRGDMSLVGPRPERPYFVDQLARDIPFFAVRHSVKPGLTGWAQVRYQYGSTVDDAVQKLQYDLYYVKNHSLFLDVLILAETVRVVLTGEGAH